MTICRSGAMAAAATPEVALPFSSPSFCTDAPQFRTPAACTAEATPPDIGETYPLRRSHRGGLHLHVGRPRRTLSSPLADIASGPALPLPSALAARQRRLVHPPARGRRLARAPQQLLARRHADRLGDLAVCRRGRRSGGLVGQRAGVSGLLDLAARRRLVSGMDDRRGVRVEVSR